MPAAKVIVEQKSLGIDLAKPEVRQGRDVTPAQQAFAYAQGLPLSQQPRYIVACNFAELWVAVGICPRAGRALQERAIVSAAARGFI